ncbi:MAG: S1 RNA-binding domain-containing protein [Bacilli bacterium]|jgi:predicted RNA-binding protein with RPS1 domain|nr:S1 RNA-binding domain-containing protein [Bacilli bacterium]MCH4228765.1 S1 RNA-binding domain-containing protein [Bacilli bacterium]MCH4278069.1 S1 RNA-binding domain-containing protein [Bacilli bacterium]
MKEHSKVGDLIVGTVVRVYPKYAIMLFENGETGLLHISELSKAFVHNFTAYVQVGNIYKVKVISYDEEKDFMKVSLKAMSLSQRNSSLEKRKIDPDDVSFKELEKKLPDWIKEENQKEQ